MIGYLNFDTKKNKMIMRKKLYLILGVLLLVGLILFKLFSNKENAEKEIQAEKESISFAVEAIVVKKSDFTNTVSYPGTVEVSGMVNVVSETDGRVVKLNIQNGSTVKKGQVIAILNNDMKTSSHQIHQIDYKKAKEDYQRYLELHKKNNATGVELETARHALETAEKQLRISQSELDRSVIHAPVGGIIAGKSVNAGDILSPGSPIAVIVPLNELEIRFNVPEKEIPRIHKGQQVNFTIDAYPQHIFVGIVSAIIPTANQAKSFPILIKVKNDQHGITLMGGMTANIKTEDAQAVSTLIIPRTAIRDNYVWLVQEAGRTVRRTIKTGREFEDQVEILSGLAAGDTVVFKGQSNINEGLVLENLKIVDYKSDTQNQTGSK